MMKKHYILSILFTFIFSILTANEKSIVVVVPSFNNSKWICPNLNSIFTQNYSNYRVIYINDCSEDDTGILVENYLQNAGYDYKVVQFDESPKATIENEGKNFVYEVGKENHFVTLVNNTSRSGGLANLYRAIYSCEDDVIIITVDGDDWLAHPNVFSHLNILYSTKNVWLTHGNLMEFPSGVAAWCEPVPLKIIAKNAFREFKCPSHLRTFYAWLFKKIKLEDLLYNGEFFKMTWDMAIMFPMIEMSGERHAFVTKANYIYNMSNPINDNKVDAELQRNLDQFIRSKVRYERIPHPWKSTLKGSS